MPPISTRRWPSLGSRPVVSVSRTISRMSLRSAGPAGNGAQPRADPARRMGKAEAGVDEEMRPLALFRIGHLLCNYRPEFFLRHARPGEHPLPLHRFERDDERDRIRLRLPAGFEEEGDIEDDDRRGGVIDE